MSHECRRCNEAIIKVLYLGFVGFAAVQRQGFSKSSLSKMFNCLTGEFLVLEQMNMQFSEWFDVFKQRKSYWYTRLLKIPLHYVSFLDPKVSKHQRLFIIGKG